MLTRTGSLLRTAFIGLVLAVRPGLPAAQAQETVSQVKSAPQEFRNRVIRLQGEVVELRAISPRSDQGLYRLVDGSDRIGLLIRTGDLPSNGGPFEIEARLSPEILSDGILLLDEMDRSAAGLPLMPVAGTLALAGLVITAIAGSLLLRARQRERRHRLAPPMWLIPTGAEPRTEGTGGPQVRFNYQLQYIEEEQSEEYVRQKRTLLSVLTVAGAIGLAGTGWFAVLKREDAARPSFVLTTPDLVYTPPVSQQERTPAAPVEQTTDTLRLGLENPKPEPPPPPPPPAAAPVRRPPAEVPPARTRETAPRTRPDTTRRRVAVQPPPAAPPETVVVQPPPVVVVVPPPPPPPAPPPAPPPVVPKADSAAAPAPVVSAEALRAGASVEIRAGIDRFVSAIRSGQTATAELMYVPEQGEERRKARFIQFLKESSPGVSVAGIEGTSVTETSGGSRFTLQFRWRGAFGADRRKAVRFWAAARREGTNWVFSGVRLLENLP